EGAARAVGALVAGVAVLAEHAVRAAGAAGAGVAAGVAGIGAEGLRELRERIEEAATPEPDDGLPRLLGGGGCCGGVADAEILGHGARSFLAWTGSLGAWGLASGALRSSAVAHPGHG